MKVTATKHYCVFNAESSEYQVLLDYMFNWCSAARYGKSWRYPKSVYERVVLNRKLAIRSTDIVKLLQSLTTQYNWDVLTPGSQTMVREALQEAVLRTKVAGLWKSP